MHKALLLAIMDDRSRLVCHAQWYMDETVETLVHGLMQALQKSICDAPPSEEPLLNLLY